MESVLETKAATILQFVHGLRGSLWVTFEEGTWAAWLYDLLKPHVSKIVVCDPRRNLQKITMAQIATNSRPEQRQIQLSLIMDA